LTEENTAVGFYLTGHPLDDYMAPLKRIGVMTLADVAAQAERGPLVTKIAGTILKRQNRKSARGDRFAYVQVSDPTALNEAIVFSDALENAGDHLEPGTNVVLDVTATMETNQLRIQARSASPVDTVTADAGALGLRVFVENIDALTSVAALLERIGRNTESRTYGDIQLRLRLQEESLGEVDIALGDRFRINPGIKGALKSISGVAHVESV